MRTAVSETKKAQHYAGAAASVGTAGVSSDDPDGVEKLTEKLAKLEARQALMVGANKAIRAKDTPALVALVGEAAATKLMTPDYMGRLGFPSYALSNNSATIRVTKARIERLKVMAGAVTKKIETNLGFEIVENAEANRVQIIFPGKPDEATRKVLKANGFRWAPSEGAWQRLLNNASRWAAERVVKALTPA
jgi:hypothetical protein